MVADPVLTMVDVDTAAAQGEHGLQAVSLEVPRSSAVALLGPNGGGKDLICRCLAGRVRYTRGAVTLNGGRWPLDPSTRVRTGAIVALANERVFEDLTVRDNLVCSLTWWSRAGRTDAIDEVLGVFPRLRERLKQLAGTLSGGEQQMVLLGRALLAGPQLVVLEEPWLGLAPSAIDALLDQMDHIRRARGTSFLWTEENRERALARATRVYELVGGQITEVMNGRDGTCLS